MGILSDIGRSNVGQVGQTMFGDVLKYKQLERQDAVDSLAAAKSISDMEANKADEQRKSVEFAQKQEQYAEMSRPRDFRGSVLYMMTPEDQREELVKRMQQGGYVDENYQTSHIKKNLFLTEMGKSEEGIKFLSMPFIMQARSSAEKAAKAVMDARTSGDPDKLATAEQKFKDALLYSSAVEGKAAEALNALANEGKAADAAKKTDLLERKADETERSNKAKEAAMDRRLGLMERAAASKAGGKELSFADKEALRSMGKQLPKSKVAAETAAKNIQKIDRMIALVDQGAGGVKGELMAKVNKVVDVLRRTGPEDARYNTLKAELRGLAGQLRVQLGIVGTTSERDMEIMYEAAGGNSPAESQKAILSGYRQGFQQDIDNYNSDANAYSEYSKASKNLYKPITVPTAGSGGPTVVETRKTKDGRILEKLSDGSIREKK